MVGVVLWYGAGVGPIYCIKTTIVYIEILDEIMLLYASYEMPLVLVF